MQKSLDTLSWLLETTLRLGADAADTVCFETTDISTRQRLGQPEGIERSEANGLALRAFVGGCQAMVSSSDLTRPALEELAQRAVAMAKIAPPDTDATLAPADRLCTSPPNLDLCDFNEPGMEWLAQQCREAEDIARATPGITNSEGADASYSRSRSSLATAARDGGIRFAHGYESSYLSVSLSVLAGEGTSMERDYAFTSARHRGDLAPAASVGREAADRALKRLNPRKMPSCQVPVIFDPRISRSLLNVLSGAISGSSIARGSSFLKQDMGKPIFAPHITIVDDPLLPRGRGSRPFDAEGVAVQRRTVVDAGVLSSWLLDMRSANKLKLPTTGHAVRGLGGPPSPSASNLYMQPGTLTPQQLISDIKNGFYVTDTFGMGVNIVTGDYSQGAAGFWIENGELTCAVSEVTIAGHLAAMFKSITPANDLVFRYAANAPTLRVESMTVAGT